MCITNSEDNTKDEPVLPESHPVASTHKARHCTAPLQTFGSCLASCTIMHYPSMNIFSEFTIPKCQHLSKFFLMATRCITHKHKWLPRYQRPQLRTHQDPHLNLWRAQNMMALCRCCTCSSEMQQDIKLWCHLTLPAHHHMGKCVSVKGISNAIINLKQQLLYK